MATPSPPRGQARVRGGHTQANPVGAKRSPCPPRDRGPRGTNALDKLPSYYDLAAEHRRHTQTTDPTQASFSIVRLRLRITKGPGFSARKSVMAYELLRKAVERGRRLDAPSCSPLCEVRARAYSYIGSLRQLSGSAPNLGET